MNGKLFPQYPRLLSVVALSLGLCASTELCQAIHRPHRNLRATNRISLTAEYQTVDTLVKKLDVSGLKNYFSSHCAKTFIYTDGDTRQTGPEFIKALDHEFANVAKIQTFKTTVLSIRSKRAQTVVQNRERFVFTLIDRQWKTHYIDSTQLVTDTWHREGKLWQIIRSDVTKAYETIDGKVMRDGYVKPKTT